MISGLKIVYGASLVSESTSMVETSLGATVPGADVKRIVEFTKSRTEGQSFDGSTPFVLAFRARRILYTNGKWEHRLSQKGASMMDGALKLKEFKLDVNGLGEDAAPDGDMLEDDEVVVQKDEEDDFGWIVPGSEW